MGRGRASIRGGCWINRNQQAVDFLLSVEFHSYLGLAVLARKRNSSHWEFRAVRIAGVLGIIETHLWVGSNQLEELRATSPL